MAADEDDDDIPPVARPDPAGLAYDLDAALASIVTVSAQIPSDAFTAGTLGTERRGNGIVIDRNGLVLTIGYIIAEAEQIWLSTAERTAAPAYVVAYDHATGLGLVQALARLGAPPLPLGSSEILDAGQAVVMAAGRGARDALSARIVAKRPFAGYWEYYLDTALFTAPAHPHWGGAACIGPDGSLVGVGSLLVQEVVKEGRSVVGNMVVPIDVLAPILDDLLRYGRANRPPRPWLGLYATETDEGIVVTGLAPGGPAALCGIAEGDVVIAVGEHEVEDLADLWRRVWARGEPGVTVGLTVLREGKKLQLECRTGNRRDFLKRPSLH
jgi:S1-C subfamily serine protease